MLLNLHACLIPENAPETAQSVLRFATGWTVRGSNPCVGYIFRARPTSWVPSPRKCGRGFVLTTHPILALMMRMG
jgi:hypothetical protein